VLQLPTSCGSIDSIVHLTAFQVLLLEMWLRSTNQDKPFPRNGPASIWANGEAKLMMSAAGFKRRTKRTA
jgi:hypothetical protein